jgi:uncharacterized RDD family membrane protein YckC
MTDISDANRFAPPRAVVTDHLPVEAGPQLAGRQSRFVAAMLDAILMMAIAWPLFMAFSGGMEVLSDQDAARRTAAILVGMAPGILLTFALQGWFLHKSGQTLGKKALKLRIVRTDGSRAGLVRLLFVRLGFMCVLGYIPFVGRFVSLVDSLLIFRASHKCLHDQLADTIVVTAESSTHATLAAVRAAAQAPAEPA